MFEQILPNTRDDVIAMQVDLWREGSEVKHRTEYTQIIGWKQAAFDDALWVPIVAGYNPESAASVICWQSVGGVWRFGKESFLSFDNMIAGLIRRFAAFQHDKPAPTNLNVTTFAENPIVAPEAGA